METLSLNVNLENLTTEEREALMKLVEKSQEKKSKVWKPTNGELYWLIDSFSVFNTHWCNCEIDKKCYEGGNCFETKEEAEEELTRRKMLTKWKRLSIEAGEDENEWNGDNTHWAAYYSYYGNKVETCGDEWCKFTDIYFPTEESLLAAIKELGEENVKKYILGIK